MQQAEGAQGNTPEMVEVAWFESPAEAQMAKGMLESAGIECELAGEHANQLIPSAFGARLQVDAKDEAAARRLLAEAGEVDGTSTSMEATEDEAGDAAGADPELN